MKALLVVDILNDFADPKGNLYVKDGYQIIPIVNKLCMKSEYVVSVEDWHPANHKSFASNHEGKKPFEVVDLNGISQVLWTDHCVQGTWGAEPHPKLSSFANYVQKKGMNPELDSYSAFFENDQKTRTGLSEHLKSIGVDEVYIVGLATDYCIKFTAIDAVKEGFKTFVIVDAIRGVNIGKKDSKKSMFEMLKNGVILIDSKEV